MKGKMKPENIRKQMMDSAGLSEVFTAQTPASKSTCDANAVEFLEEVSSANPKNVQGHFSENLIASDETPRQVGGDALLTKKSRSKSIALAIVLTLLFGPFGLIYVSWKRAAMTLLLFIIGVSLIPKNGFVVLLLWLVFPIMSLIAFGVGKRQSLTA